MQYGLKTRKRSDMIEEIISIRSIQHPSVSWVYNVAEDGSKPV